MEGRLLAISVSVGLHLGLLVAMSAIPNRNSLASPRVVEMSIAKPPAPRPEAVPAPPAVEPEPRARPKPEVRPKLVKKRTAERIARDEPKPSPEPQASKPPPTGFSIDMASTVVGGQIAVRAIDGGGNMFADPSDASRAPGRKTTEAPPPPSGRGAGSAGSASYVVTSLPRFLGTERDRTPPYPEAAKRREIEGQVLLNVFVGSSGRVEDVRILKRLEPSCDEVAVRWARERWRFQPALAGREPVGMWITVPVTFVIDR